MMHHAFRMCARSFAAVQLLEDKERIVTQVCKGNLELVNGTDHLACT
jgi:hypothetical protein